MLVSPESPSSSTLGEAGVAGGGSRWRGLRWRRSTARRARGACPLNRLPAPEAGRTGLRTGNPLRGDRDDTVQLTDVDRLVSPLATYRHQMLTSRWWRGLAEDTKSPMASQELARPLLVARSYRGPDWMKHGCAISS